MLNSTTGSSKATSATDLRFMIYICNKEKANKLSLIKQNTIAVSAKPRESCTGESRQHNRVTLTRISATTYTSTMMSRATTTTNGSPLFRKTLTPLKMNSEEDMSFYHLLPCRIDELQLCYTIRGNKSNHALL
jgi:hypothetical protein